MRKRRGYRGLSLPRLLNAGLNEQGDFAGFHQVGVFAPDLGHEGGKLSEGHSIEAMGANTAGLDCRSIRWRISLITLISPD